MKLDNKKSTALVSGVLKKATDMGKTVVDNVQTSAKDIADKTKNESYLRRLKKYNPLFPEQYNSESFNIPNMIRIVDDAVRRDIDVCVGAIGWLSTENGIEILNLYDEAVSTSNIQFIPAAACDEIYYVDNFDRKRFIRIDYLFSKAHEERLAELQHIAYSLGAKRCSMEILETDMESEVSKNKFEAKSSTKIKGIGVSSGGNSSKNSESKNSSSRKGVVSAEFEGSNEPRHPDLKWFKHDDNINRLIEMRCNDVNAIKTQTLRLEGAASATMSQKAASSIDGAISKMGSKKSSSMEKQAMKENTSKMVFVIEF